MREWHYKIINIEDERNENHVRTQVRQSLEGLWQSSIKTCGRSFKNLQICESSNIFTNGGRNIVVGQVQVF